MLISNAVNYIRGYLVISAEGRFLERFINICARRGILLSGVRRTGSERLRAEISPRAFLRIRGAAFKTRTRVRIVSRRGLPFLLRRYRRRKYALFALLLAAALFWYTTGHVMGIDIIGCEKMNAPEIESALSELGVALGTPLDEINTGELQNSLVLKFDEIAWAGINIRGSRMYVEIKERLAPSERIDKDTPCNLAASRDGEISEIDAREGQSMVRVGDGVAEGDLLVSGIVDSTSRGMRLVHAFGEVYARTRYEKSAEIPLEYEVRENTGRVKTCLTLRIFGLEIPLYLSRHAPFEYYEETLSESEWRAPFDALPSVFLQRDEYAEQTSETRTRTVEEAAEYGAEHVGALLDAELPEGVEKLDVSREYSYLANGNILVTVRFECRENIAVQVPIETDYSGGDAQ